MTDLQLPIPVTGILLVQCTSQSATRCPRRRTRLVGAANPGDDRATLDTLRLRIQNRDFDEMTGVQTDMCFACTSKQQACFPNGMEFQLESVGYTHALKNGTNRITEAGP